MPYLRTSPLFLPHRLHVFAPLPNFFVLSFAILPHSIPFFTKYLAHGYSMIRYLLFAFYFSPLIYFLAPARVSPTLSSDQVGESYLGYKESTNFFYFFVYHTYGIKNIKIRVFSSCTLFYFMLCFTRCRTSSPPMSKMLGALLFAAWLRKVERSMREEFLSPFVCALLRC